MAAAVTLAGLCEPAAASVFRPCGRGVDCGRVSVPLDRSGAVPGTLQLRTLRIRAASRRAPRPRDAVVALSGGPGESALPFLADIVSEIQPALRTRDLLLYDQRGTGSSGLLRCPGSGTLTEATRRCAARLGRRATSYTTVEAARDIEAVRQASGARRLTLYGVSYGTKLALVYARLYPDKVERLVLDSVVDPLRPDPFDLDVFSAVPRVIRELCASRRCQGVTSDPVADLQHLVGTLAKQPLAGHVVGGDGRRRVRALGRLRLLDLLVEGDFDPGARAAIPGAVRSALRGDPAPLLRLERRVLGSAEEEPASLFDYTTFVATSCADGGFPWDPGAGFADRWGQVMAASDRIPASALAPFDRETARASALLRTCTNWPSGPPQPDLMSLPVPDVPTLILSGSADMRTPLESARALAALLPRASVVVLPGAGHSVLPNDLSGCAARAVDRFFSGKPVSSRCPAESRSFLRLFGPGPAEPVAPAGLAEVDAPPGVPGRAGRTVRAAGLTFLDVLAESFDFLLEPTGRVARVGGLRSGRAVVRVRPHERLRLDHYSYVPGVRISMASTPIGANRIRLRVGGRAAARGWLRLDFEKDRVYGRLGGRRVGLRLSRQLRQGVDRLYAKERMLRAVRVSSPSSDPRERSLTTAKGLDSPPVTLTPCRAVLVTC